MGAKCPPKFGQNSGNYFCIHVQCWANQPSNPSFPKGPHIATTTVYINCVLCCYLIMERKEGNVLFNDALNGYMASTIFNYNAN